MLIYLQADPFSIEKLFEIASKISTPLALAGICVVVVFLILWRILGLAIFESVGGSRTAEIIKLIVGTIFVLALVAVVLGIAGYVFISVYHPPSIDRSSVNIPEGFTIKSAAEVIVRPENFTVSYVNCSAEALGSEVLAGPIIGKSKVEVIENLARRRKDMATPLSLVVTKNEGRGFYEITCK